jgi:hypothetical protein
LSVFDLNSQNYERSAAKINEQKRKTTLVPF